MKVLVTGGAGFIGSHLTERLVAAGHEVLVLDDMSSGRKANLEAAIATGRCRCVVGDIRDRAAVEAACDGREWVFHLAGRADIVPSIENPVTYFEVNVTGTLNVLEAARHHGVRRFIYAASSSCYGIATTFPTPETAPVQPEYPYALTKAQGEELVLHWAQLYGMPAVSLRLFNVFGPRARTSGSYGAVFGVFLGQRSRGLPLTIVGDGEQTRDFTYVTDVAAAFEAAAESSLTRRVFNVGSGGHYSVNHLANLLGGPRETIPKRPGEPDCTFADTTAIRRDLGWTPAVSFEEGVARMVEELPEWRSAPAWTPDTIADATKSWFRYLGSK
ncbi:SDR family oxidoreductase [uncultured Xylophilus sp.]|uniref:SDR family oxidoreductase n=1 Tax=uncultured Xylophilus sp. TaxID=296832 RepID=UPI0025D406B7|nr:SDR family oxidoreductase [uncultured Xylophilus sp.]